MVLILPGLRKLMPVPYKYLMPDFSWLDKEKFNRFKIPIAAPVAAVLTNPKREPKRQAAPLNQTTLFYESETKN